MDVNQPSAGNPALESLLTRASDGNLRAPAPEGAELDLILQAGLCAPDHGKLRPWRYVLIGGGEARARFVALAVAALRAREPACTEAEVQRMTGKLTDPPLIVALGVHTTPDHPKVPAIEQVMAVAAGAMNILNAAHALGFTGKWITGPNAYDPAIATALGLPPPHSLAGFLYLGTAAEPMRASRRPLPADHVANWTG